MEENVNELQNTDINVHEKTSDTIKRLRNNIPEGKMTLGELVEFYNARELVIIILIAPFLLPASIPGSSTPFGILIIIIALSEIFSRKIYLPNFIAKYEIEHSTVEKLFDILIKALGYVEKVIKPRGRIDFKYLNKFNLAITILLSFLLFLPLPIPFTDFFPSLAILLLVVGNLENDTYIMTLGYIATVGTLFYFYQMGSLGISIIVAVLERILPGISSYLG